MMKKRYLLYLVCGAVILFAGCHDARKTRADLDLFSKANASYKQNDYKTAVQLYEQIPSTGLVSEAVYFNLGNAYFKLGQLGRAIVNYERALRLEPRDGDLKANMVFVKSLIPNPEPQASASGIFIHLKEVTLDEIVMILVINGIGLSGLFLAGLFLRWRFRKTAFFMSLMAAALVFHVFALFAKIDDQRDRAVILATVDVKYEPEDMATTHFIAGEGWKVRILKESSGWVKIERPDGLGGWVPKGRVERI